MRGVERQQERNVLRKKTAARYPQSNRYSSLIRQVRLPPGVRPLEGLLTLPCVTAQMVGHTSTALRRHTRADAHMGLLGGRTGR